MIGLGMIVIGIVFIMIFLLVIFSAPKWIKIIFLSLFVGWIAQWKWGWKPIIDISVVVVVIVVSIGASMFWSSKEEKRHHSEEGTKFWE